jgi:hypothetical protein
MAAVCTADMLLGCGAHAQETPQGPPANLRSGPYRALIETMWRDSATFRQQCLVLASEPELTVRIRGESRPSTNGTRARGEISVSRDGRVTFADIVVMSPRDTIELIAHELEHLLEQLEGVRLRDQGCHGTSMQRQAYESCRAVEAGRRVAREVEEARVSRQARGGR